MNFIKNKVEDIRFKAYFAVQNIRRGVSRVLKDEEGDTNFLSIIIILAIVLLLAIAFIAFKDKIIQAVNEAWTKFVTAFNGQTTSNPGGVTPP